MPLYQPPGSGLRHIVFLAVLGLAVVFLSGPVIALASVVPAALLVKQTYLIFSEVNYKYLPLGGTGYVVAKTGIPLSDVSYTRPRQNTCITYNGVPVLNNNTCPMT